CCFSRMAVPNERMTEPGTGARVAAVKRVPDASGRRPPRITSFRRNPRAGAVSDPGPSLETCCKQRAQAPVLIGTRPERVRVARVGPPNPTKSRRQRTCTLSTCRSCVARCPKRTRPVDANAPPASFVPMMSSIARSDVAERSSSLRACGSLRHVWKSTSGSANWMYPQSPGVRQIPVLRDRPPPASSLRGLRQSDCQGGERVLTMTGRSSPVPYGSPSAATFAARAHMSALTWNVVRSGCFARMRATKPVM
ncbi:MAG: hypothetical protein QOF01_841, partial [Thermomicrobiales bacterium]|nr:hypothetical protein [Thermomicrobiales bacterium]